MLGSECERVYSGFEEIPGKEEKPPETDCATTSPANEGRFRHAFDNAPIGMAIDFNFRFRRVNAALCRALGYAAAELLEQRLADITHADDLSEASELTDQLLRGEVPPSYRVEKRFIKRDGSVAWLDVTAVLMRDDDGVPLYGLAMLEDITERKRSEEALRAE